MITGLIPADTGTIEVDGHDVTKLAHVPPRAAGHRLSAAGSLDLPRPDRRSKISAPPPNCSSPIARRLEAMVEELLAEFGITHMRNTPAIALSGGERRRVEIARALATHPSYILLDEPFAGIDPIAVGEIRDLVRHLKDRGIGVLITDHNVRDALDIIDRAYILHDGRVLKEGTPARDRQRPRCAPRLSRRKILAIGRRATTMALSAETRDTARPVAGHDAAIAAGDQAAAIVQYRAGRILRSRTGAQSASGARRPRAPAARAARTRKAPAADERADDSPVARRFLQSRRPGRRPRREYV